MEVVDFAKKKCSRKDVLCSLCDLRGCLDNDRIKPSIQKNTTILKSISQIPPFNTNIIF